MLPDSFLPIANLLLPEVLVTYFDLKKHEIKGEELHFYFTEQNNAPKASFQRLRFRISPYVERASFCTSYVADGLIRIQVQWSQEIGSW